MMTSFNTLGSGVRRPLGRKQRSDRAASPLVTGAINRTGLVRGPDFTAAVAAAFGG